MGFPRQSILTRKLIKSFIKRKIPNYLRKQQEEAKQKLLTTIKTSGFTSSATTRAHKEYLVIDRKKREFKNNIQNKKLDEYIISKLNKPFNKYDFRGEYRDYYTGLKPILGSIYDGIKMED